MSNLRPWLARRAILRQIGSFANMIAMGAAAGLVLFLLADAVFAQFATSAATPTNIAPLIAPRIAAPGHSYDSCADARAAGDAPLMRDDPGYGPHLDADRDGVACEPYP